MVAASVAPRAVELAEGTHVPRRLLQVVPRLVAHPAGLVFATSPEALARPVHEDSTAEVRASKSGGELLGTLVAVELREEKRAWIADERPAAGSRNEGRQGEVAVRNLQAPGLERFDRDHGVGAFPDGPAPDGADARGAGGGVALVGRRELPALVVVPGEEVGHARHGVGAVHGRRALLQDLDPVQRDRRERVHVHEAASVHPHRHVRLAPAVEQHQRPRGSQAAKVHAGDRLGHGGGLGRVGEAVPFAEAAVAGAQVLEEVRGLGRPLFGEAPPARHRDRVGEGDGRVLEGGAGHDDLDQLQRRGVKPRVERRRLSVGDGHGADEAREADQLHVELVDARPDAGEHEPSVVVRQHADAQARDVDLSRRERRARGRVGDGSRNGSALGAGLRRCQRHRRDGRRKDPSHRPSGSARRLNSAPQPTPPQPTAPRPRASREWIRLDHCAMSAPSSRSSPIRLPQVGVAFAWTPNPTTPGRDRASPAASPSPKPAKMAGIRPSAPQKPAKMAGIAARAALKPGTFIAVTCLPLASEHAEGTRTHDGFRAAPAAFRPPPASRLPSIERDEPAHEQDHRHRPGHHELGRRGHGGRRARRHPQLRGRPHHAVRARLRQGRRAAGGPSRPPPGDHQPREHRLLHQALHGNALLGRWRRSGDASPTRWTGTPATG